MNREKYLPLGSIVLLKGAKKKIMVIGFMASSNETEDKVFDYMGCMYPEGVLSSDQTLVFDHEQIDQIYYMGYSDEEEKSFKNAIKEIESNNNENKSTEEKIDASNQQLFSTLNNVE